MLDIINIIEIKKGILSSIVSFPITHEENRNPQILKAEELFRKLATENGAEDSEWEMDDLLSNGNWDNENGYEVLIVWSHEIKE